MSVQLRPVTDSDEFSSSWWTWRPVWNVACDRQPILDRAVGNHNDAKHIDCELLLRAIEGVTAGDVIAWCKQNNYHVFKSEVYDEFLVDLRVWLEKYRDLGCVIG